MSRDDIDLETPDFNGRDFMSKTHFNVAEVNAMLPRIQKAARMVQQGANRLTELSKELFDGQQPQSDTLVDRDYMTGVSILVEGVETIGEMGGQVKDLSMGMVDFPSMYKGREVLLCWMPGEDKIGYWHDPDAGFAGRSAIEDENEFHGDSDDESN
jgi:hypothetical protein